MTGDEGGSWSGLVAELAGMPEVVARLRALHTDDGTGHCRACTTPGRGTPWIKHPCSLAALVRFVDDVDPAAPDGEPVGDAAGCPDELRLL